MTKEEFNALSKEKQDEILSGFNDYLKFLENDIWDHDPGEYGLEWYLMFKCRDYNEKNI